MSDNVQQSAPRLVDGLSETPYALPRGNGAASIPFTGGNASDLHYAKPASAAFFSKADLIAGASVQYDAGKIFLGRVDNKMIGIADDRHIVTLAGSGGGKSVCSLIPNLLMWGGSALVLDPKGELAAATAEKRRTMGQNVLVVDPWGVSGVGEALRASFNPLAALVGADADTLIDDSDLIADALIIPNEKEPHWTDSARGLVRACILVIVCDDGEKTITRLPELLALVAATKGTCLVNFEAPDMLDVQNVVNAQGLILGGMGEKERGSIVSTSNAQLTFLNSPALSASAFAFGDLKREAATIYLCLPASRMGTHSRWLRLCLNMALASMEREKMRPNAPPVLFVLEEMAALGHMKALERAVAYLRGFGVKVWAVLQDITQLQRDYEKSWQTFLGNAGIIQAFSVNDDATAEYLSKIMGQTTLVITNKQEVSSSQSMAGDTGLKREFRENPLMSPAELRIRFAHKVAPDGKNFGGASLVLWSGKPPMMVERVYYGELVI